VANGGKSTAIESKLSISGTSYSPYQKELFSLGLSSFTGKGDARRTSYDSLLQHLNLPRTMGINE